MIKIFSVFCSLMIFVPYAVSAAAYYDPRDSEISRLTAEKQRKYAELEKCAKSVKGLQIAGISTIGLTAGGVALNISQANKSKTLDNQINATNLQIEKKEQEIEDKRIKEEKERAEKAAQEKAKAECESDDTKTYVNGKCVDKTSAQAQQTESVTQTESVATADNTIDTTKVMGSESGCRALASTKNGTECYQDSDGEWEIRWTVKEGDPCPISECFDQTNTATCKYVWVPSSFVCVADTCKTGYKVFGHMCQKEKPITCDETKGEIVATSGDECLKCTEGHIAHNGHCEQCPWDKKPAGNKCIDYTCGPSEFKTWGDCTKCQQNHIVENNHCVECPKTKKAENNRCVDFTCPSNMFKLYGECHRCDTSVTKNMVPNADQSGCEQHYTTDAMDDFKSGCRAIGGRLDGPNKCYLPNCNIEYREIEKQCDSVGKNSGFPIYIGRDGNACYCEI
ncbi:MAG: hypothetical protein MJ165_02700 [Alphaproteobacteria bacterium]|nr:hypothetical protein [Alphaproteobacteria bacterium]